MDLILWRHADAEAGTPDSERKLTAKGIKQSARMAKWLRARIPDTAVVLVRPAKRAQQTAQALTADEGLTPVADDQEKYLAPGWVDVQVNGFAGRV